jgi:lipopolysaccharide biosynthesis glycosyltransferase
MTPLKVFIGFDEAEPVAFHACAESVIRNSSVPVSIIPLYQKHLNMPVPPHIEGYPPSNGFIFTRFMVPELSSFKGLSLFIDGDMVVEGDVAELFAKADMTKAISVVKHDYTPKFQNKYLGAVNQAYPRKNWSSVILWNCDNFKNRKLTSNYVAHQTGQYLHRFEWLSDDEIGELPKGWNYLVGEDNQDASDIKLLHFTSGTPCWMEWRDLGYSANWDKYHSLMNDYKGRA